jgi:NAD(P)-dependent dehydrogenase (short-subunit alcohol dehydrogenase family)
MQPSGADEAVGDDKEIARTALFLASPDSSFLLGTEIVADGGLIGL